MTFAKSSESILLKAEKITQRLYEMLPAEFGTSKQNGRQSKNRRNTKPCNACAEKFHPWIPLQQKNPWFSVPVDDGISRSKGKNPAEKISRYIFFGEVFQPLW